MAPAKAPPKAVPRKSGAATFNVLRQIFSKLMLYSILMFSAPFLVFFLSLNMYLDPIYAWTIGIPAPEKRALVSGVLAVLVVNLVVGSFIFTAFRDEDAVPAEKKED